MSNDTITAWEQGNLADDTAAHALALNLAEIEDEIKPLEAQKEQIRNVLSRVVGRLGDKYMVEGFGELVNTAPAIVETYDKDQINALIVEMSAAGAAEWAQKLARCKKQTSRSGTLRITREKKTTR